MATTKQSDDIQALKLDVGLIKGDIKTIKRDMSANQKVIIDRMDKFAFVSQKDYDRDMKAKDDEITELRDEVVRLGKLVDAGGLKIANALNSGVSKAIIAALVIGLLALIVWSLARVTPALPTLGVL